MAFGLHKMMRKEGEKFYENLRKENKVAFDKLGSATGQSCQIPEFSKGLEELASAEIGHWSFGDPSLWGLQSWIVAKWDSIVPQLKEKTEFLELLCKFLIFGVVPIFLAIFLKLAKDDKGLEKFVMFADLFAKLAIIVILLKLLKVAQVLEVVSFKAFGVLTKLEFGAVCAGGNINKLLSMSASKLTMLELRTQEQRGDDTDTGRDLTNYLTACASETVDYLCEGVKRRCQTWVETRKMNKDLDPSEFAAAWGKS